MNTPISSPSRDSFQSPVCTPIDSNAAEPLRPKDTSTVSQALQTAFAGMQFNDLFEGLHSLFHIKQVVITGSAAKAIHALLNPKRYPKSFRTPGDIDVIVSLQRLMNAPLQDASRLGQFGLKMLDASKPHILEYSSGEKTVKIDLIPSDMQMVRGKFNDVERHGSVAISNLQSLRQLDKSRLSSGEGNAGQIQNDLLFFDSPATHTAEKRQQKSPDSPPRKVKRRLM